MEGERDPRTYAIIGAAIEVHQQLGHGFLEPVYQEAMAIELGLIAIPFQKEVELPVVYKAQKLKTFYKADFLCFESVIVELKALSDLSSVHEAQVLNYLKATGLSVGLLLNFGAPRLEFRRLIFSSSASLCVICGQFFFCLRIDHGPQEERPDACATGSSVDTLPDSGKLSMVSPELPGALSWRPCAAGPHLPPHG
jgi:GxxExxY protein